MGGWIHGAPFASQIPSMLPSLMALTVSCQFNMQRAFAMYRYMKSICCIALIPALWTAGGFLSSLPNTLASSLSDAFHVSPAVGFLTGHLLGQFPDSFRAAVLRNTMYNRTHSVLRPWRYSGQRYEGAVRGEGRWTPTWGHRESLWGSAATLSASLTSHCPLPHPSTCPLDM